jgi:hypothetical protein
MVMEIIDKPKTSGVSGFIGNEKSVGYLKCAKPIDSSML